MRVIRVSNDRVKDIQELQATGNKRKRKYTENTSDKRTKFVNERCLLPLFKWTKAFMIDMYLDFNEEYLDEEETDTWFNQFIYYYKWDDEFIHKWSSFKEKIKEFLEQTRVHIRPRDILRKNYAGNEIQQEHYLQTLIKEDNILPFIYISYPDIAIPTEQRRYEVWAENNRAEMRDMVVAVTNDSEEFGSSYGEREKENQKVKVNYIRAVIAKYGTKLPRDT